MRNHNGERQALRVTMPAMANRGAMSSSWRVHWGDGAREFTVPAGTALFLSLLNNLALATKPAPQPVSDENQVPQLRTSSASFIDDATELHVALNGVSLLNSVAQVKSPAFQFTFPDEDSLIGLPESLAARPRKAGTPGWRTLGDSHIMPGRGHVAPSIHGMARRCPGGIVRSLLCPGH